MLEVLVLLIVGILLYRMDRILFTIFLFVFAILYTFRTVGVRIEYDGYEQERVALQPLVQPLDKLCQSRCSSDHGAIAQHCASRMPFCRLAACVTRSSTGYACMASSGPRLRTVDGVGAEAEKAACAIPMLEELGDGEVGDGQDVVAMRMACACSADRGVFTMFWVGRRTLTCVETCVVEEAQALQLACGMRASGEFPLRVVELLHDLCRKCGGRLDLQFRNGGAGHSFACLDIDLGSR